MTYQIGDMVRVKITSDEGVVQQYKFEGFLMNNGQFIENRCYLIKFNDHFYRWYYESELEPVFNNTFEKEFIDLLIDVNLLSGNVDMLKKLSEQKKRFNKK